MPAISASLRQSCWTLDYRQGSHHLSMYRHSGLGAPVDQTCTSLLSRYLRSRIKALAPGGAVRLAKAFTPDMVQQASGDGSVRRVGPFEMRPGAGAGQRRESSRPWPPADMLQ